MFHIDNNTGVPVMPPVAAEYSKTTLYFTEGGNGIPPTYPGPDWFNIVQSEMLEILRQANIKPDKNTTNQIMTALKKLFITNSGSAGAIAELTGQNNTFPYFTGEDTMSLTPLSAFVRSILGKESATDFADALKVIKQSGDTMTGELKIRGVNALRIFDEAFGLIFRRSEECLHLIPTSEGQGENGDIGPLRPFAINLRTGEISMSHKVSVGGGSQVNGALGIGVQNALGGNSIAFGDNDTGLKQNGDGILDVYANNQHVLRFQSDSIQSNKAVNVTGRVTPSDYANIDARYKQRTEGVEDIRLGGQRVDGHYDDDFTVPSGYVVVGGDVHPSTSLKLYSRPLQKLINGTWYNAASV